MNIKTPRSTYRDNFTARSMATSRMSTGRREKLEAMRASASGGPDRLAKRDKLRGVLKEKLVGKYGTVWKNMVIREVDEFIRTTMNRRITENDLAGLENGIRRKTQSTARETSRTGRSTARGTARGGGSGTARPETTRSQRGNQTEAQKLAGALDDWTLLDAFDALNNETDVKQKKSNKRLESISLKRELDAQVSLRKSIEEKQKAEDRKYYTGVLDEVVDFHREEKEKAAARQKVVMKMAAERQRQMQVEKKKKGGR